MRVGISGLSSVEGFYEVWNYDINELRCYAFRKTVRVSHMETGEEFSGPDFEAALRAQIQESNGGAY